MLATKHVAAETCGAAAFPGEWLFDLVADLVTASPARSRSGHPLRGVVALEAPCGCLRTVRPGQAIDPDNYGPLWRCGAHPQTPTRDRCQHAWGEVREGGTRGVVRRVCTRCGTERRDG